MVYRPTPAEVKRAEQLTRRLTPGKKLHASYVFEAKCFLGLADLLPFIDYQGQRLQLEGIRWHQSDVFSREYLIAHVDDCVLAELAPECDAIATVTSTIPLILVPVGRRRARGEGFRSILEHEVVHVNQVLLGSMRSRVPATSVAHALTGFFREVRIEFEANLIQLTSWPRLFPSRFGLTLEQWCALRGWTSALEWTALGAFCGPKVMGPFLSRLASEAPRGLATMGVSSSAAAWLVARHGALVRSVLEKQLEGIPSLAESSSFLAAVDWLHHLEGNGPPAGHRGALSRPRKSRDGGRSTDLW